MEVANIKPDPNRVVIPRQRDIGGRASLNWKKNLFRFSESSFFRALKKENKNFDTLFLPNFCAIIQKTKIQMVYTYKGLFLTLSTTQPFATRACFPAFLKTFEQAQGKSNKTVLRKWWPRGGENLYFVFASLVLSDKHEKSNSYVLKTEIESM